MDLEIELRFMFVGSLNSLPDWAWSQPFLSFPGSPRFDRVEEEEEEEAVVALPRSRWGEEQAGALPPGRRARLLCAALHRVR
jgi:hypothetical protein